MRSSLAAADVSSASGGRSVLGMAALVERAYAGADLTQIWNTLVARLDGDPLDAEALLDLSYILLITGEREKGLELQRTAIGRKRIFEQINGTGDGLRVLVFVTAGDLMANTPVGFLLADTNATLLYYFVDHTTRDISDVPDHDVAFVAVGESESNAPVLQTLSRLLAGWRGPILNNAPGRILGLTRDGVSEMFADAPMVVAPATVRLDRETLLDIASGKADVASVLATGFPIIARPVGTHAGHGLERIEDEAALRAYLASRGEAQLYIAPFIDYSGPDGLFRKQRIAFIGGRPFASHWATSEHWIVHYLSAGMAEHEQRRLEEARWMRDFDSDFAIRHRDALAAIASRIGLDYFAIDCAELADGRLLLFEADVAMIVHAMDPAETFPYKKPAMAKLFQAFHQALLNAAHGPHALCSVTSETDQNDQRTAAAACI